MTLACEVVCPVCEQDTYEVCSTTRVTDPKPGQQAVWRTTLACGHTVNDYHVWYPELGWV